MNTISFKMSDQENELFELYLALVGINKSTAVRDALMEKIFDYLDAKDADEAYREYIESGEKGFTLDEVKGHLGI